MARPKTYPTFYCSHCQQPLKRLKAIYHDCGGCGAHYKVVEGELVTIAKRPYRLRKVVSDSNGKCLTADEYEALVS